MASRGFLDDIDRLFDELVFSPWKRPVRERPVPEPHRAVWEARLPAGRGDLSVAVCGRVVTVSVMRRGTMHEIADSQEITAGRQEVDRQSFTLPEGSSVESVEAAFEGGVLRVRVHLGREDKE
jgi:HSP20 family molecular chaperone IbpA